MQKHDKNHPIRMSFHVINNYTIISFGVFGSNKTYF